MRKRDEAAFSLRGLQDAGRKAIVRPIACGEEGPKVEAPFFEKLVLRASVGEMAERFKAHAWKACWG